MLSSIKILDFSDLVPGPYATMVLADLGADVLRVESPDRPAPLRYSPPLDGEESAFHHYLNRSKRAISLDLKKPESVDLIKRLIKKYDVVLEQFRPGVMTRLGLDYQALREVNPKIIYCSLTGYGQTGPMQHRAGHDINCLSIAGVASYQARPESGPIPLGVPLADVCGGSMHAVISILAAVINRLNTGAGQAVDISLTDTAFALNTLFGVDYLVGGIEPRPAGREFNGGSFYDYYQTDDGRYFSVGSMEPHFRKKLCEVIGQPNLFELSISDAPEDVRSFKEVIRLFFQSNTYQELQDIFAEQDVCVEPVLKFSEACEHPQIQARQMVVEVPKAGGSPQKQIALPIKFSEFVPEYKHVGTSLGADTFEVLQDLGLTDAEIDTLREKGVFGK